MSSIATTAMAERREASIRDRRVPTSFGLRGRERNRALLALRLNFL
jgi:hypothetical protein